MTNLLLAIYDAMVDDASVNTAGNNWAGSLERASRPHVEFFKNASTEITLNSLAPNATIAKEIHAKQDQVVLIVVGALRVVRWIDAGTMTEELGAGKSTAIAAGTPHELTAIDPALPTKFITVYANV